jgi:hypothetical protein
MSIMDGRPRVLAALGHGPLYKIRHGLWCAYEHAQDQLAPRS